jgi:hypothetical protein
MTTFGATVKQTGNIAAVIGILTSTFLMECWAFFQIILVKAVLGLVDAFGWDAAAAGAGLTKTSAERHMSFRNGIGSHKLQ